MLNGDRRQDVGLKLVYSLLTGVIAVMLTVFFIKTYNLAEGAQSLSQENRKDVAVLQQCVKSIDLTLIKMDLKLDTILTISK